MRKEGLRLPTGRWWGYRARSPGSPGGARGGSSRLGRSSRGRRRTGTRDRAWPPAPPPSGPVRRWLPGGGKAPPPCPPGRKEGVWPSPFRAWAASRPRGVRRSVRMRPSPGPLVSKGWGVPPPVLRGGGGPGPGSGSGPGQKPSSKEGPSGPQKAFPKPRGAAPPGSPFYGR